MPSNTSHDRPWSAAGAVNRWRYRRAPSADGQSPGTGTASHDESSVSGCANVRRSASSATAARHVPLKSTLSTYVVFTRVVGGYIRNVSAPSDTVRIRSQLLF